MRVVQQADAAWSVLEGHAYIVPHGGTGVVELDEVGTFLWVFLEEERTLEEMVAKLCQEFEVEPGRAREDCESFVEDLEKRGMVTVTKGPP